MRSSGMMICTPHARKENFVRLNTFVERFHEARHIDWVAKLGKRCQLYLHHNHSFHTSAMCIECKSCESAMKLHRDKKKRYEDRKAQEKPKQIVNNHQVQTAG